MIAWLKSFFSRFKKFHKENTPPPEPVIETPPEPPKPMPPSPIYEKAKSCLGTDIAATQNELGCAEAVSYIFNACKVQYFPAKGFLSTADFYKWLKTNAVLVTDEPQPGDIIISPTGTSTIGSTHGHIGVVGKFGIMSNNSMNGLFQQNYTMDSWTRYYHVKLGFPVLYYRAQ